MNTSADQAHMERLTAYLTSRREALLNNLRTICEADTTMHCAAALSREEFNDHMPTMLNILEHHLLGKTPVADVMVVAAEHGWHRWHKGYPIEELLKEVEYLRDGLTGEISTYWSQYPQVPGHIVRQAYQQAGQLFGKMIQASVLKYNELQAITATQRSESLQQALSSLNQLEQERGELLRMTSHDLQSGLGIVEGAAQLMNLPNNTDQERDQMLEMMQRNLSSVRSLLQKLSDLARLEAGQDSLDLDHFDVSALLRSVVESVRPLATNRGILLQADGPAHLTVESDRVKVQRIVQNLLLNAIQYTPLSDNGSAWISVSWTIEDVSRWSISVQDSGPGLPAGPATLLAAQLIPNAETTSIFEPNTATPSTASPSPPASPASSGEGLGLHIVKRLCEALRANLDVEIKPGTGTLFRIRLLKHWDQ